MLQHLKGRLGVCLVYGENAWHTYLVGLIDSNHECDIDTIRSLAVGLIQILLLKMEKYIMFYDRLCIQKSSSKVNMEDMVTSLLPREKFKLWLDSVDVRRR